jgi:hypothetical protein
MVNIKELGEKDQMSFRITSSSSFSLAPGKITQAM